ncbi:hypothetical protein AVEN_49969-1, partial [Araneus ventricosus]
LRSRPITERRTRHVSYFTALQPIVSRRTRWRILVEESTEKRKELFSLRKARYVVCEE